MAYQVGFLGTPALPHVSHSSHKLRHQADNIMVGLNALFDLQGWV